MFVSDARDRRERNYKPGNGGRVEIHFKLESPWSNLFIYVYLLFFSRSKVDCAEFISIYIILFM